MCHLRTLSLLSCTKVLARDATDGHHVGGLGARRLLEDLEFGGEEINLIRD
jgi:hypothetical protein